MACAGDPLESAWAHAAYVLGVAALAMSLPAEAFVHTSAELYLTLGLVGAWRYSWGAIHFGRSIYYRKHAYPRLIARAAEAMKKAPTPDCYLLLTTFKIDRRTTARVYRAAFEAARAAKGHAVVVASIVDIEDQELIEAIYETYIGPQDDVRLDIVRIPGTGKRDALAHGFRAVARYRPAPHDLVAVIDGDSIVPVDLVARCAPIFAADPGVGAVTTDERCETEASALFRHWWSLRFAQRQVLMCSMGLSDRVLTLTGRMSMFRADIICNPDFIDRVESDYIDHWRLGRFKFLTGDDKSSWFWLLQNGFKMLYLPDVTVVTVENPPSPSFLKSASMLMFRWFGNMLRTNGRAAALGPRRIGFFTWWAIIDQRVSMWTCLTGVAFAVLGAIFLTPLVLTFYVTWILASRYVMSLTLLTVQPRVSIAYPFLLYFNQIFGSVVKTFVLFRLNKQKWTRQKTTLATNVSGIQTLTASFGSVYMHVLSVSVFFILIGLQMGVFNLPSKWLEFTVR